MDTDQNFFKKNGYLLKKNLINKKTIDKINKVINEVVAKDKQKNKQKVTNRTQSYDNYHFVYSSNSSKNKEILRLNNPQNRHKIFYELSRNKKIISIVKKLIGGSVRFHLGKLNFKLPNKKKGSEVGWHQDWAFYPHTNDDLVTVGIYLDDCTEKNGPLKIIKNSHTKKLSISPISPFRPRRWRGKIVNDKSKITITNLNPVKRPISAVADNLEVRNAKSITVKTNNKIKFNLLYDKNRSLQKKIKIEQLRRETN